MSFGTVISAFAIDFASPAWLSFRRQLSHELLMRGLSYSLIVLSIVLLACASYDEYRGSTTKPWTLGRRHHYNSAYLYRFHVLKENNPELFHQFMKTHWIYAASAGVGGIILFLWNKNQEDFNL